MCTATVLALPDGGYLLAANRDEHTRRGVATPPAFDTSGGTRFVAPRDRDAGGTWIAVDEHGRSFCLLNGDRPAAGVQTATDAPSRGLLLLDLVRAYDADSIAHELEERRARGVLRFKPFKLLVATPRRCGAESTATSSTVAVVRIDWDGRDVVATRLTPPLVEVSNGLDPERVARHRRQSFAALLPRLGVARAAVCEETVRWHRSHRRDAPAGDLLSVCMHHSEVHSVSLTWIEVDARAATMRYQGGQPCDNAAASEQVILLAPSAKRGTS